MRATEELTCLGIPSILRDSPKQPWCSGLIYGPTGVGKSYRAAGMCNSVEYPVWINTSRYLDDCRWAVTANLDEDSHLSAWKAIRRLEKIPFIENNLVIDDIAVDKPSEFAISSLYSLLETRWANELRTIVTSNLGPQKLAELLGDRISSRIVALGTPTPMVGVDRRVEQA